MRSVSPDHPRTSFADEKKTVESSPRRKLPSIPEHNSIEEDPEEGKLVYLYKYKYNYPQANGAKRHSVR